MAVPKDAPKGDKPGPKNPPNQTLYVSNLDDKLHKKDVRREIYLLFSTYGTVLDVVALKTMKMRGQAFVVYQDNTKAIQAMRSLQGYEFFGKKMNIEFAKTKSHFVSKLDGTFNLPTGDAPTTLQQSIFNHAPSSLPGRPAAAATHNGDDGASPASTESAKRKHEGSAVESSQAKRTKLDEQPEDEQDEGDDEGDDEGEAAMDESD